MKKAIILFCCLFPLMSACSILMSAEPTATPSPTSTPDPCSGDQLVEEMEALQYLVNEFRFVTDIANSTDINMVVFPILRLQEIRQDMLFTDVPECLEPLKSTALQYTSSVINYLTVFMTVGDPESESIGIAIQNSQEFWQNVVEEFNSVLTNAGLEPMETPDVSSVIPPGGTGVLVTNDSDQRINVREQPSLVAEIIAFLEPGMQALAAARTEEGDWIQINIDDVIGWVSIEFILLSDSVDAIPIIEETP